MKGRGEFRGQLYSVRDVVERRKATASASADTSASTEADAPGPLVGTSSMGTKEVKTSLTPPPPPPPSSNGKRKGIKPDGNKKSVLLANGSGSTVVQSFTDTSKRVLDDNGQGQQQQQQQRQIQSKQGDRKIKQEVVLSKGSSGDRDGNPGPANSSDKEEGKRGSGGLLRINISQQISARKPPPPLPAALMPSVISSHEVFSMKIKSSEAKFQAAAERAKTDAPMMHHYATHGIAQGAPDLHASYNDLLAFYSEVVQQDISHAMQTKCAHRLCVAIQKQSELFGNILSSKDPLSLRHNHSAGREQMNHIGAVHVREIQRWAGDVATFAWSLREAALRQQPILVDSRLQVKESMSALFAALGDLAKQKQAIEQKHQKSTPGTATASTQLDSLRGHALVWGCYLQANVYAPWIGSNWKSMASVARRMGCEPIDLVYHLCRSLAISGASTAESTREHLLPIFEEQIQLARSYLPSRNSSDAQQPASASVLSGAGVLEHLTRFKTHFLAACGMAYSRTDVDHISVHAELARRHLSISLQMIDTEASSAMKTLPSGSGPVTEQDKFYQYRSKQSSSKRVVVSEWLDQCAAWKQSSSAARARCANVEDLLVKSSVICMSLIYVATSKYDLASALSTTASSLFGVTADTENNTFDDEAYTRRFVLQQLQRVQGVPSFVSLAKVYLGSIVNPMLRSDDVTVVAADPESDLLKSLPIMPAIYLFLQWLEGNSDYHVLSVVDKALFEQTEAGLLQFLRQFRCLTGGPDPEKHGDANVMQRAVLSEDFSLRGFAPLAKSSVQLSMSDDSIREPESCSNSDPDALSQPLVFETLAAIKVSAATDPQLLNCGARGLVSASFALQDIGSSPYDLCAALDDSMASAFVRLNRCKAIAKALCMQDVKMGDRIVFSAQRVGLFASSSAAKRLGGDSSGLLKVLNFQPDLGTGAGSNTAASSGAFDALLRGFGSRGYSGNERGGAQSNNQQLLTAKEFNALFSDEPTPDLDLDTDDGVDNTAALTVKDNDNIDGDSNGIGDGDNDDSTVSSLGVDGFEDAVEGNSMTTVAAKKTGGLLIMPKPVPTSADKPYPYAQQTKGSRKGSNRSREVPIAKALLSFTGLAINRDSRMASVELPLIVVDAPNVAMKHGHNKKFSCGGIRIVINYFKSAGHRVVAFLPDYYLNFERAGQLRRVAQLNISDVKAAKIPDNIQLLQDLVDQGIVVSTPAQDYDDSYCINYAKQRSGYVVSNDMYRDQLERIPDTNKQGKRELRDWLKSHLISFTFAGDEFIPNPDARFDS